VGHAVRRGGADERRERDSGSALECFPPVVCEDGEGSAPVIRRDFPADIAFLDHVVHQVADAALAHDKRGGQIAETHLVFWGVGKAEQDLEFNKGTP
jgi:hypothetical protein